MDKIKKSYVGSGWRKNFRKDNEFIINIDLLFDLLPSPDIYGKIHLTISPRKKLGTFDETHSVYINDYKALQKTVNVERSKDDK